MDRRKFLKALATVPVAAVAGTYAVRTYAKGADEFIALSASIDRSGDQWANVKTTRQWLKKEIERRGASVIGSGVDSGQFGHRITVHGSFS